MIFENKQLISSPLFPRYGFVQCTENQVNPLNNTKGLKYVLRNGSIFLSIANTLINEIKNVTKNYETQPLALLPKLHSDVTILYGPLSENLLKVMSFSDYDRVKILFKLFVRNVLSETALDNLKIS